MPFYINLSILSNEQKNLNRTERQKLLSTEARRILSICEGRPITEDDMAKEQTGRPFFPASDTDFSISHSGALTAVSLVRGQNLRTGCDVELVRPRTRAKEITQEFFTAPEREYIESRGHFDEVRFYQIWTLKECYLKLRGLSVFDMPSVPSFMGSEDLYTFGTVGFPHVSFNLYELTGGTGERYILAVALEGADAVQPEVRWFSEDCLIARKI